MIEHGQSEDDERAKYVDRDLSRWAPSSPHRQTNDPMASAIEADRDRYRAALADLLEAAEDMRSYVPDYFAKKWKHDEALEAARKVLRNARDIPEPTP